MWNIIYLSVSLARSDSHTPAQRALQSEFGVLVGESARGAWWPYRYSRGAYWLVSLYLPRLLCKQTTAAEVDWTNVVGIGNARVCPCARNLPSRIFTLVLKGCLGGLQRSCMCASVCVCVCLCHELWRNHVSVWMIIKQTKSLGLI